MITITSRRFFSITWEADSMHSPPHSWSQYLLHFTTSTWLIILFHGEAELWYTLGRSEEGVWLSQSRLRCGKAPGWRAAGTDSSQRRWSKMCLLRHLWSERWCFITPTFYLVKYFPKILLLSGSWFYLKSWDLIYKTPVCFFFFVHPLNTITAMISSSTKQIFSFGP